MSKFTDWYPAGVSPARKGVYQVCDENWDDGWYAYWNGKKFGYRSLDIDRAMKCRNKKTSCCAFPQWRGLVGRQT